MTWLPGLVCITKDAGRPSKETQTTGLSLAGYIKRIAITVETLHITAVISFKASADRRGKKNLITRVWRHRLPAHFSDSCWGESGPESSHEPPHGDKKKIYEPAFPRRERCPLPCLSRIDGTQRGEQRKRPWRTATALLKYSTWQDPAKKGEKKTLDEQEGILGVKPWLLGMCCCTSCNKLSSSVFSDFLDSDDTQVWTKKTFYLLFKSSLLYVSLAAT